MSFASLIRLCVFFLEVVISFMLGTLGHTARESFSALVQGANPVYCALMLS